MADAMQERLRSLIGDTYAIVGTDGLRSQEHLIKNLYEQRALPDDGWDDATIEYFLRQMSLMDSNNFTARCGVGEREGRIYSRLVWERHRGMVHGIGRSGDIAALQPKACGSSAINMLTQYLALHALRSCGLKATQACYVVPVATGMGLNLCLNYLRTALSPKKEFIIWSRIDQKSCFKAMTLTGLTPVVVELTKEGDTLKTSLANMQAAIQTLGASNVLCVITTTSTFAPRVPDSVDDVAKLCLDYDVPHIINNAYGVQDNKCCHLIEQAMRLGRVDFFVQSIDKNFMVPVGGCIIASPEKREIEALTKVYPGRASSTPTLDLLITLLAMGKRDLLRLREEQRSNFAFLKESLLEVCPKLNLTVLETPNNKISIAIGLGQDATYVDKLGPFLYLRRCSGARLVKVSEIPNNNQSLLVMEQKDLSDDVIYGSNNVGVIDHKSEKSFSIIRNPKEFSFVNFGSHSDIYPVSYLTVASAIGSCKKDTIIFIERFRSFFGNQVTI